MDKAISLALAASFCTATSSVCQRLGARNARRPGATGVDIWLIFRLARRPIWLAGLASMILGFVFQLAALHFGALALVQLIVLELLFVFGYMAVLGSGRGATRLACCGRDVGRARPAPLRRLALRRTAARAGLFVVASRMVTLAVVRPDWRYLPYCTAGPRHLDAAGQPSSARSPGSPGLLWRR